METRREHHSTQSNSCDADDPHRQKKFKAIVERGGFNLINGRVIDPTITADDAVPKTPAAKKATPKGPKTPAKKRKSVDKEASNDDGGVEKHEAKKAKHEEDTSAEEQT